MEGICGIKDCEDDNVETEWISSHGYLSLCQTHGNLYGKQLTFGDISNIDLRKGAISKTPQTCPVSSPDNELDDDIGEECHWNNKNCTHPVFYEIIFYDSITKERMKSNACKKHVRNLVDHALVDSIDKGDFIKIKTIEERDDEEY